MNAPYAHTWLEIVGTRWGKFAHLVFMFFGLATNVTIFLNPPLYRLMNHLDYRQRYAGFGWFRHRH